MSHKDLIALLANIEFASGGYCPSCGGWGVVGGQGCSPRVHSRTCELKKAIAALEADKQGEAVTTDKFNVVKLSQKYDVPQPDRKEIEDEPTEGQYQQMYFAQCDATDVWVKKYHEELDRKADATLLARCEELEKIAEHANKLASDKTEEAIALRFEMTSLKVTIGHLYDKYNAWPVGL